MPESLSLFAIGYIPVNESFRGLYACRFLEGAYGSPELPFESGVNEWFLLSEAIVDEHASYYSALLPKGNYRIEKEEPDGFFDVLSIYQKLWHGTEDIAIHLDRTTEDLKHKHEDIIISDDDRPRLGNTLKDALDNALGADWDRATDVSLKGHLSDAEDAHSASAITNTAGIYDNVQDILSDHEIRLNALETGNALLPEGIADFSGEVGIVIRWNPQNVNGIEYFFRYLWKHTYESIPESHLDLQHERRQTTPETEVIYGTRRFDIAINTENDLVLYYAVGAKGRADSAPLWSSGRATSVIIPPYKQEQILTLSDVSWAQVTPSTGSDTVSKDTDELFPTASGEVGGLPLDNWLEFDYPFSNATIEAIAIESRTAMSGDSIIKFCSEPSGETGSILVSALSRKGITRELLIPLDSGDVLKLWSLEPYGMGHISIKVKLRITS